MIRRILWLVVALLPLCQSGCCWCHPWGPHHCCCSPAGNEPVLVEPVTRPTR